MPLKYQKEIIRRNLRDNPQTLYVFGDNMIRAGYGGQAAEMRGEPNAIGIITKVLPAMHSGAFLSDKHLSVVEPLIRDDFKTLKDHLAAGGEIVWPEDDIGTGRAQLQEKAPKIWALIQQLKGELDV